MNNGERKRFGRVSVSLYAYWTHDIRASRERYSPQGTNVKVRARTNGTSGRNVHPSLRSFTLSVPSYEKIKTKDRRVDSMGSGMTGGANEMEVTNRRHAGQST